MQQEIYVFRLADKIAEPQFFTLSFAPSTNRRYYIIRMLSISNQFMITKIDTSVMAYHNGGIYLCDHKDRYLRYDKP